MEESRQKRKRLARHTYTALAIFLTLALVQWIIVCLLELTRKIFRDFEIYCSATFALAGILFSMFVFNENMRSKKIFSWVVALLIVQLHVISMLVLVARTWVPDLLAYYFFCVLIMIVALVIGCNLSFTMDLTEYIAPIFLMSFIFVTVSLYFMVAHVFMANMLPYAYLTFEVVLTIVMILITMLHAQTINGDRLIQMSLDDFVLAALFLFHEFLITYAMTFYWQINHNYFTTDDFFWKSTSNKQSQGTTPINPDYEYDLRPDDEDWEISNETSYDWANDKWLP